MIFIRLVIVTFLLIALPFSGFSGDLIDLSESPTNSNMQTNLSTTDIGDLNRIQAAFNSSKEFQNTLVYQYNNLSTYKVRLRTSMDTLLILPEHESITIFNFADDVNFSFVPLKTTKGENSNMGIIKNLHHGADTNLIIIGESGNSYNFYVRTDDYSSKFLPHLKVFIEDKDFKSKLKKKRNAKTLMSPDSSAGPPSPEGNEAGYRSNLDLGDYLRKIDNTPMRLLHRNQDLDFRYIIFKKGNVISPKAVFDDGYWTYFRMATGENLDKVSELPVVLKVINGIEQPVNTRVVRNYIIAETTGATFALRVDNRVLCIEKRVDHEKSFLK